MIWLNPSEYKKQIYKELRLYAPKDEKIPLDFEPLRISDNPNWNPMWEEWHCYFTPLRIYKQDYELLMDCFNKIYPIKDAFDGNLEPVFDVCSYNWIGKDDWQKIIFEIEKGFNDFSYSEKSFFQDFLEWLKEALKYTTIIVVEGNE